MRIVVESVAHIGDWQSTTVAVGAAEIVALFALARFAPNAPGALIVVITSILAGKGLDLAGRGVKLVAMSRTASPSHHGRASVPSDSPTCCRVRSRSRSSGSAQSPAIANTFAVKHPEPLDANQELIGYGAASLGAGALQGYAVTGSLSKSADSVHAGGKTPLLLLVTSALVVLTALFLDGLFKDLPETILAAIVIQAVWGMIDFSKLTTLPRPARRVLARRRTLPAW